MSTQHAIGVRLRKLRQEKSLTQSTLGELAGKDPSEISKYENGERMPDLASLEKLAAALDTSPAVLLFGSESDNTVTG